MRGRALALVASVLFVLTCRESTGPFNPGSGVAPSTTLVGNLLSCPVATPDSGAATIGVEGGTLIVGPHWLRIPPGALDGPVAITAHVVADTVVAVVLGPDGLTFDRPAYLSLSYADCGLLRLGLPKRIAYTTDLFEILSYLLSWDNLLAHRVTGQIEHFSTYAVAW